MPCRGVDQARVRVERDGDRVGAARRPDVDLFAGEKVPVEVGQHGPAGLQVDVRGPVDADVGVRGDQRAVGAVDGVEEAVLVGLHHHLAHLAVDLQLGEHLLVDAVHVVHVVGRVLVVAVDLARLRADGEHGRSVQAVEPAPRRRVVGLGVAGPPVHEVEFGIVRARAPRGRPAVHPRVGARRPSLVARFAGPGDGVAAPELLAGGRVPAVEEAAGGGLAAGHPRDEDPVGHHRSAGRVVPLRRVGELLLPQLLAGLHVEGEHMVVDGHPEEPALVDHRPAPVEVAAPPRPFLEDDRRAPDLPPRLQVDGEGPASVDGVEDAVVDGRRGQLARLVHHAGAPDGHEPMDVRPVDLVEGAVALAVVPHAVDEHVLGGPGVVDQVFRRLREARVRPRPQEDRQQSCRLLHDQSPSTRAGRRGTPAAAGVPAVRTAARRRRAGHHTGSRRDGPEAASRGGRPSLGSVPPRHGLW